MIGKTLGHYRIKSQLGKGGMGEVYVADDLNLNRKVALKFLPDVFAGDPERMARFEREARLLASLNHPNIAAIYGLEQAEGKRFIVMELVEGETLAARIGKGALPVEDALAICRQIAEGLEAAHEKGVIHRDLKPANVMIADGDKVKILDFGLAKALSDEAQTIDSSQSPTLTEAMTRPGVILGTAAYMSPEQAKGKSVDKRADIWAFGCILYECLTGRRAFDGETVTETLAAVLTREPEWDKVPAKMHHLLRRFLEKDPRKRSRDALEAMEWTETVPESAPVKRPWIAWSTAALLFLALLTISFLHIRPQPSPAKPMRLEMNLPENVTFGPVGFIGLSPDGRKFALIGTSPEGISRLYLRTLDGVETRPLPGTESNQSLSFFWSPDSRFIAFACQSKLKKMDVVSGGPPQTICELAALVTGGAWNVGNVILYADYMGSNGIMRVPAAGGTPSPVTKPDPLRQEENHILPLFLPDGRHFLCFCNSSIPENQGIYVGSLDAKPEEQGRKQVVRTAWSGAAYVPARDANPGYLLFMREQALVAQPFDDKRMQLTGEALPIAEHISYFINTGLFSASENGILVYKSGGPLHQLSQPAWFDGQGKQMGTIGALGSYYGLSLRPDGSQAAMSRLNLTQGRATIDLWLHDFARATQRQFTFGQGENISPVFSPDGSRVVFASNRDGGVHNLYQQPVSEAREEEPLAISKEDKVPTSWSADGRFVLFTARNAATNTDLWVLPMELGRKPVPFLKTGSGEFDGHFSPDGRWVAYVSDEEGSNEIYVRRFLSVNGTIAPQSGSKWRISGEGGTAPRWSRDGRVLYFRSMDGKVMAADIVPGPTFSAGSPRLVFPAAPVFQMGGYPLASLHWDVASDGKRFLLVAPGTEGSRTSFDVILDWTSLFRK
jgi:serine/threonine protein kinase